MFLPGSPCGCCGGPCQPCQYCAPPCLTVTFEGFAHGTGNCGECDFLDDTTFELKRPPDPQLSVTASVPSATGSGATFSVTTARNATDGSYVVSGIKLLTGGANYSIGDTVAFQTNGCFDVTPTASITLATTQPVSTNLRMASPSSAISPYTNTPGNISVTYSEQTDGEGNKFWTVSKLGAIGGGFGYAENQTVTLTPGWLSNPFYVDAEPGVVVQTAATVRILTTQRIMPLIQGRIVKAVGEDVTFQSGQYGLITLSEGTDANGRAVWSIASISPGWWFPSDFTSGDTVQITVPTGVTTVQAASVTLTVNGSGAVTAFNIVDGGQYHTTNGRPETVELLTGGAYYKPGVITSVTLVSGGKVWGPQVQPNGQIVCLYSSDPVCPVCPGTYADPPGDLDGREELYASLQLGSATSTLTVWRRSYYTYGITPPGRYNDIIILSATRPNVDAQGNPIPCDSLTFEPEHFSEQYSCVTNGTVTVTQGTCGDSSQSACQMPDQITMSLEGMGRLFAWSARGGGSPPPPCGTIFCGECEEPDATLRQVGSAVGLGGYSGSLILQDFSEIVLDREVFCGGWVYRGYAPSPATSGYTSGGEAGIDCGGELSVEVTASIYPVDISTSVLIESPNWGSYGATAEVTISGEAVSAITVTNGGEGYAREVFERTEPTMAVTLSGGSGSGVVLSAALTQSGAGEEAYWYVSAVTVTNGGTGYSGQESVVFTPEEGTTTAYPAYATVATGRTEPTVTASVSGVGGNGSGAVLAVTMASGTDYYSGLDYWYVESVAVTNGGSGFYDGAAVTFTVTDGTQEYAASATPNIAREEPEVTASVSSSGGSGASMTVALSQSGSEWAVSSVTISGGGTGYAEWDFLVFSTDGVEAAAAYAIVSGVDGNGAITAISVYYGGSYYKLTGVIESVNVDFGGSYYKSDGIIQSVSLFDGGSYYKEQSTNTSEVQEPKVFISSRSGYGASATANVDGTLGSATFGQVISVTVDSGGYRYVATGAGWLITLWLDGVLGHLQNKFFEPLETSSEDATNCLNFGDRSEFIYPRVSLQPCPTDLLDGTYSMAYSISDPFNQRLPEGFADYCVTPAPGPGFSDFLTIFGFPDGITVTLSPGGGEEEE